jgi:signal transduction histidine kinase
MITATSTLKILLIEDNLAEARLLKEFIKLTKSQNFSLVHVQKLQDGINQLNSEKYDVILLDLTLPDSQGLASIPQLLKQNSSNPIIVLTNINDEELAIEAVRQGAQDYLFKRHVNPDTLVRSVRYAIERQQFLEQLNQINQTLETQVEEKTAELLKSQEKQLNLIFTSSENCLEYLGDETLLKHIVSNLLNNAIKYSPPDSTVLFELIKQEKTVILRFQDQGIGITETDQKQLFQPFHRGENVGIIPGSGLGLTIVKQCVIAHRGEITVNSQVGVGSTFTVTLPITK